MKPDKVKNHSKYSGAKLYKQFRSKSKYFQTPASQFISGIHFSDLNRSESKIIVMVHCIVR